MASCLVTVGSTKFEELTSFLDDHAEELAFLLKKRGITKLKMQIGKSKKAPEKLPKLASEDSKFEFEYFGYTNKFKDILSSSSLVISHAGAGSIAETLRLKIPLLVVVNETLMDNHQKELAEAMAAEGYLYWTNVDNVLRTLESCDFDRLKEYPTPNAKAFADFLDREVGFA
mmetsp:Transcript_22230/g.39381  ORF Transcript_22230/g.39381 Transcript_22230/m.39381 type:complete len:172 (-) Transcript_22230:137-652(-)